MKILAAIFVFLSILSGTSIRAQNEATSLPNGVAAGDVTQTSVVLWTHSTELGPVSFEWGTDSTFGTRIGQAQVDVADPLLPVKLLVETLQPGTRYYYRATDSAGSTAAGTFRTPAEVGTHNELRFGVSGDARGELSPFPSLANAAGRDLDFFIDHGDTIYADYPSPDLPAQQARSLQDYRTKQNEVYSTRYGLDTLAALRKSTAIYATIDDHEVMNDFAGGSAPDQDFRFTGYQGAFINETELYTNGLQAFQDYNPLRDEFYGDTGDARTANKRELYRYNTFGSDAAIFLLDARSFRDAPVTPISDYSDQGQVLSFLVEAANPERTMLGKAQLEQLEADLLAAQAAGITWKFILLPEPIQNLGVYYGWDRFEGYSAERTDLLRFINEQGITNTVFISADLHGTIINNLSYQETPLSVSIPIPSFEIVTGPIAYDAPFGPTLITLGNIAGLLTDEEVNAYKSLSAPEKDAYLEQWVNMQLEPLDFSPIGLQDADMLDAELVQGSYLAVHYYGWTEFDIDAETQQLRVTTYGIEPYTKQELDRNPDSITSRTPEIVSEFTVNPQ